jgi:5-methylcytosine-specific restriction endonuclease McrA
VFPKPSKPTKHKESGKSVKALVYQRDGGKCVLCGEPGQEGPHHIVSRGAVSEAYKWDEHNLATLCPGHHNEYANTRWVSALIMRKLIERFPEYETWYASVPEFAWRLDEQE